MSSRITCPGILALLLAGSAHPGVAQMHRQPAVQGLIGFTIIDEVDIVRDDGNGLNPSSAEGGRVDDLISLGGIWQQSMTRFADDSHLGVEYGFIFSYGADDRRVTAANGVAVISIDSSLMLGDACTGIFVSHAIGGKARIYAAGGPLLMWGRADGDFVERPLEQGTEITLNESDSAFGFGGYVRAGIEFEWPTGGTFGIGARGFASSLDLDVIADDADIEGIQGFVTFTQGF